MRRKKIWTLGLVVCLSLAIAGFADAKGKPQKSGGKIPVSVTFQDLDGVAPVGNPDRIMSDCQQGDVDPTACPYTTAFIGAGKGNFHLRIGGKKDLANRKLFLDFTQCTPSPCTPTPPPGFFPSGKTVGVVNVSTSGIDLREMGVPETKFDLGLTVTFEVLDGTFWTLFFKPNADCPGSSTINVTRTDADTWLIEAGQLHVACLAHQARGGDSIFSGLYHMPFKITVEK